MRIEVEGQQYQGFISAEASLRVDALSNTFGFATTTDGPATIPFKGGEAAKVFVDGEQVLDGFVEIVNVDGSSADHSIAIQGRDKTGDLLDSSISALADLTPTISLAAVCRTVISHIGANIKVVDQLGPPPFNKAEDLIAPEPGDNAFEFLETLARKRQALLSSDKDGNLVITRASGTAIEAFITHRRASDDNNILRYSVSYDTTGRFNLYKMQAQLNPLSLAISSSTTSAENLVSSQGDSFDTDVRRGRQLVLVAESMFSNPEAGSRALWERNMRRARGRTYGCTVSGYRNQTGALWTPNTVIHVVDEYADIEADMLVNTVTFSLAPGQGRSTTLALVEKNAYTLELDEPEDEKIGDNLASIFSA